MIVLNNFLESGSFFIIENDADDTKEDRLHNFHDEIHGLSECVDSCSFEDGPELLAPSCFYLIVDLYLLFQVGFWWSLNLQLVCVETCHQFIDYLIELFLYALVCKIDLFFYFLEHQSLLVHEFHVVIGGICVNGNGEAYFTKVSH